MSEVLLSFRAKYLCHFEQSREISDTLLFVFHNLTEVRTWTEDSSQPMLPTLTTYLYTGDRLSGTSNYVVTPLPGGGESTTLLGSQSYTHDGFGRMTFDGKSGLSVAYHTMDLPRKVSQGNTVLVNYSYLSDGMKTRALTSSGEGLVYRGGMVYRRSGTGTLTFESAAFGAGRLTADGVRYHITDHLGSVRAVVDGSTGNVLEAGDYAAYGLRTDAPAIAYDGVTPSSDTSLRYHFSGKEDQTEFIVPYTDFGARHYNTSLRRWMVPDPMGEKYYNLSPYVYCTGDPVNHVDPDGEDWFYYSIDGEADPDWHWREEHEYHTGTKEDRKSVV